MEDRRRFPRIDTTLEIKYYSPANSRNVGYTISNNVSKGGISMPALSSIAKSGELIKLDINNKNARGYVSATGKVRWVAMRKRKALLDEEAGIEFVDITPADIDRLVKAS